MNKFSRKKLKEKAVKVFQENKGSVIYATSDGQMFFNRNRAELHANSAKLTVYDIPRSELDEQLKTKGKPNGSESGKEDNGHTVDDLKALVAKTLDFAELAVLLEDEKAGKNRVTAIAAIDERVAELKAGNNEPKKD